MSSSDVSFGNEVLDLLYKEMMDNPKDEYRTVDFWSEYMRQKFFPSDENYVVTQEGPPRDGSRRRLDLRIRRLDKSVLRVALVPVLHGEMKNADPTAEEGRELETQGWTAGRGTILTREVSFIYVMTAYGPWAKFWIHTAELSPTNPVNIPMREFGSQISQNWEDYVDVGGKDSWKIASALAHIKNNLPE